MPNKLICTHLTLPMHLNSFLVSLDELVISEQHSHDGSKKSQLLQNFQTKFNDCLFYVKITPKLTAFISRLRLPVPPMGARKCERKREKNLKTQKHSSTLQSFLTLATFPISLLSGTHMSLFLQRARNCLICVDFYDIKSTLVIFQNTQ